VTAPARDRARRTRAAQAALVALALLPAASLVARAAAETLGANPIETVTHVTGEWTLRLLLLTLAVTPARRWLGWSGLAPYRRTLGLLAFAYACVHFSTWLALDHFFDWSAIVEDIAERPYVTAGFAAFLCLVPLAVTSTRGWVRRLGRRWSTLHRLAYAAGALGVVHFLWLVKADRLEPLAYGAALLGLLALRLRRRAR
jgi:sulfoxide reductase heme-binding subunit YedZ